MICADAAPTLNAHFGDKLGLENQHINGGGGCSLPPVSLCLNAGGMGRIDAGSETLIPTIGGAFDVAHTLKASGGGEDGTGRGVPIIAIQERAVAENPDAGPGGKGYSDEGAAYTLEARNKVQAVAFDCKGTEVQYATDGSHPTLRSMGSHAAAAIEWDVRRLTPVECERLQGFPDNFTRIPGASKGSWREVDDAEDIDELRAVGLPLKMKGNAWLVRDPDGPRYKALGNSMAVNVMTWIGERIALVEGGE